MKARFKSKEARQQFIEYGEKQWAINRQTNVDSNNNRRIARVIGMNAVDVVPCSSPFDGWWDIIIDGDQFESISAAEVDYFEFIEE
ncbi:hypothetical protein Asfd1_63 [Aeromonas phage Asfd_1]|nr:hypothetical protein Asfd1_63 [Aeromonas phage Asfd_1]